MVFLLLQKSKAKVVKEGEEGIVEDDGKIKKLRVGGYCPNTSQGRNNSWEEATKQFEESFEEVCKTFTEKKDGKGVLPVFLAPEWSFRKPNKVVKVKGKKDEYKHLHQFFSHKEMRKIVEKLRTITKPKAATTKLEKKLKKIYEDVLVVSGSILWAMTRGRKKLVYNTTVVLCGGEIVHVYHKQFWGSDTKDGGNDIFVFKPDGYSDRALKGMESMRTKNVDDKGKVIVKAVVSNTFEHAGLSFGIEICADHNNRALAKNYGGKRIDVHILISCGARLYGPDVVARIGGIALSTDGFAPNLEDLKANCFGWAKVEKLNWSDDNGTHDNKTFISEQQEQGKDPQNLPKCSWVYNDLIEFD